MNQASSLKKLFCASRVAMGARPHNVSVVCGEPAALMNVPKHPQNSLPKLLR